MEHQGRCGQGVPLMRPTAAVGGPVRWFVGLPRIRLLAIWACTVGSRTGTDRGHPQLDFSDTIGQRGRSRAHAVGAARVDSHAMALRGHKTCPAANTSPVT